MGDRPTVLVPVRVLEGEAIPEGVPRMLAEAHVILLGYHVIPEQTAPGQAQMQWEDRARERLADFETLFEEAGATVEPRLVFTQDGQKTIDRQIDEHEAIAVLVPNTVPTVDDVLVPVRGTIGADRLARVVGGLFAEGGATITLLHVAGDAETDEDADTLLDAVGGRLTELGVADTAIERQIERDVDPLAAIVAASDDVDVVVMGESDPSLATFFFGMPSAKVRERFMGPVLVVQRERPDDEE